MPWREVKWHTAFCLMIVSLCIPQKLGNTSCRNDISQRFSCMTQWGAWVYISYYVYCSKRLWKSHVSELSSDKQNKQVRCMPVLHLRHVLNARLIVTWKQCFICLSSCYIMQVAVLGCLLLIVKWVFLSGKWKLLNVAGGLACTLTVGAEQHFVD